MRMPATMNLHDVLITEELASRPSPQPDYQIERDALTRLARQLASEPEAILRRLVEEALELTGPPTAGISLMTDEDEGEAFYWPVVVGEHAERISGGIPVMQSPCNVVVQTGRSQLFHQPQRYYPVLRGLDLDLEEVLLVPLGVRGRTFGTLWALSYDRQVRFHREHARRLESLADMAAAGYAMVNALDASRRDRLGLQRQTAALETERAQLQAVLEQAAVPMMVVEAATGRIVNRNAAAERVLGTTALPVEAWRVFGEGRVFDEAGHALPAERWPIVRALRDGETVCREPMVYHHPEGEAIHLGVSATPVRQADGSVVAVILTMERSDGARAQELPDEVQRTRAEAEQRDARLRELALELTYAEQRERQRLARLLHDHLQQYLVAARMHVEAGRHGGQSSLQDILELLDLAIDASRNLASELSPPVLFNQGLCPALHWLARWMRKMHKLQVNVDTPAMVRVVDEAVRVFLFDAVRELLFNVTKHANSSHAWVQVQLDEQGHLHIAVDDAGGGARATSEHVHEGPRHETGGFGLATIRRRLEIWGGRLETGRSPYGGFHVGLHLPLPQAPSSG